MGAKHVGGAWTGDGGEAVMDSLPGQLHPSGFGLAPDQPTVVGGMDRVDTAASLAQVISQWWVSSR